MKILDPIGTVERQVRALAPRPASLAGRRIGILDNSKPNAAVLLGRVAELLAARTGARPARWWQKPGSSRPALMIDEVVAGSDVVLTGSADWGSCTSWSLHDTAEIEGRGVPAVVLGTDAFISLAREAAATLGMPHLAVVTVPHPLGGIDPALVRAKADDVVDRVLEALVRDPVPPAVRAGTARDVVEVSDDLDAFQEIAMERGWSDGLPVLPPTPERVARLLAGVHGAPADLIATLMPRRGAASLEAIAINAAMAGAGPEHMPVIVAAVLAVADPAFNLNAILTTTHPCTPLVIVNGPIAARLGIHGGPNAFGNGHRANAVIGRALRLVLQNVAGATPGELDRATLGHPGKFTYCIAENEAASPWAPLSVERGLAPGESAVTVVGADAPHNVNDHGSTTAEGLVRALASVLATTGSNNVYLGGEPVIVLGPEHAATIAGSGWAKADLKRQLWRRAHVRLDAISVENLARFAVIDPPRFTGRPPDATVGQALAPEDLIVVVAGGPGKHSAVVPTFGATHAVTSRVEA